MLFIHARLRGVSHIDGKNTFCGLFRSVLRHLDKNISAQGFTPRTKEMFLRAADLASRSGERAGTAHFLLAVLEKENCFAVKILRSLGVDVAEMKRRVTETLRALAATRAAGNSSAGTPVSSSVENVAETNYPNFGKIDSARAEEESENTNSVRAEERESGLRAPPEIPRRKKKRRSDFCRRKTYAIRHRSYGTREKGKLDPVIGREKEIEKWCRCSAADRKQSRADRRTGRRKKRDSGGSGAVDRGGRRTGTTV